MPKKTSLVFLVVLMFLSGCYQMVKKDTRVAVSGYPAAANRYLAVIDAKNEAVADFKAIGKVRLWDTTGVRTTRAAWLGTTDGRLRVEFLGLPGQPVAKFIFDGHRFYFYSGTDPKPYERKSADPDLTPVTGVDIKTSEVITCLAGGIPLYAFDSVDLEKLEKQPEKAVLILKKTWLGVVEKVFFNGAEIEKVEVFRWGDNVYEVDFNDIRCINNGHQIPFHLKIDNGKGAGFSFSTDRYWTDITIPPAAFDNSPVN